VLPAPAALAEAEALDVHLDCVGPPPGHPAVGEIAPRWHYAERVPRERFECAAELRVPLALRLPYAMPESDPSQRRDAAFWTLRLDAAVGSQGYSACFDLPVFHTDESDPDEHGSRVAAPAALPRAALASAGIRILPWGTDGQEIVFGMARSPRLALVRGLATLIFGALLALFVSVAGLGIITLALGGATLFLLGATLEALVGATRVRADPAGIRVTHGPLGLGPTRTLEAEAIARIHVVPETPYGNQRYFQIRIAPRRSARDPEDASAPADLTAGRHLPSPATAEALAEILRATLGRGLPNTGP